MQSSPSQLIGLDGKPIRQTDLILEKNITENKRRGTELIIKVPYPKTYPETQFKKNNKEECLAELFCTFRKKKNKEDMELILHTFYVYTSPALNDATPEERFLTKGLGHRMLCEAVDWGIQNEKINDAGTIELDASGGKCNDDMIQHIMDTIEENEMDILLENFPQSVQDIQSEKKDYTKYDKARMVCDYKQNQRLVSHYKKYGLDEIEVPLEERSIWSTQMSGNIKSLRQKCNK